VKMSASERQMFALKFTNVFARIGHDPLVHILSDGSNGEWKMCCSSTWFHESTVSGTKDNPTCLMCIVEDAAWWRRNS
jgi:hypothetical protein